MKRIAVSALASLLLLTGCGSWTSQQVHKGKCPEGTHKEMWVGTSKTDRTLEKGCVLLVQQ